MADSYIVELVLLLRMNQIYDAAVGYQHRCWQPVKEMLCSG